MGTLVSGFLFAKWRLDGLIDVGPGFLCFFQVGLVGIDDVPEGNAFSDQRSFVSGELGSEPLLDGSEFGIKGQVGPFVGIVAVGIEFLATVKVADVAPVFVAQTVVAPAPGSDSWLGDRSGGVA